MSFPEPSSLPFFSVNPQVLENLHLPIKLASIILIKESPTQLGPQLLSNNCPISSLTSFYHRIAWAGGPQRLLSSSQDNAFLCAQPGRRGSCGDAAVSGTPAIESLPALWFFFLGDSDGHKQGDAFQWSESPNKRTPKKQQERRNRQWMKQDIKSQGKIECSWLHPEELSLSFFIQAWTSPS